MGKLFDELKRRKVFRVAGVYAVVGWVLAQVAAFAVETFAAPQWVQQIFVVFLILGFPLAIILAWAYEVTPEGVKVDSSVQSSPGQPATSVQPINYVILAIVLLVAGFQIVDRFVSDSQSNSLASNRENGSESSASTPISNLSRRSFLNLGATIRKRSGVGTNADIALSPDGRRLVFSVQKPGETAQIYVQELDQIGSQLLPGTENGRNPFFSPDGEWIGFWQDGLKKISIRGGQPQLLTDSMRRSTSGFWGPNDTIYYTSNVQDSRRLRRIAASGGEPDPLEVGSEPTDLAHYWSNPLPDGDGLLYSALPFGTRVWRTDLLTIGSGEVRTVVDNAYNARYVPTGHIVFIRAGSLWAVPFDLARMQTTGQEVPVVEGVQTDYFGPGDAVYAFSNDGLLTYLPAAEATQIVESAKTLVWVDRDGSEETLSLTRAFRRPVVSPDGERLAVEIRENNVGSIWTYDLRRNALSRLTFGDFNNTTPLWTPDGERIVYSSSVDGGRLWWRAANGTGQAQPLLPKTQAFARPTSITADGSQLVYTSDEDIYLHTLNSDAPSTPLLQSEFAERRGDISPDGRWIAYSSDETGQLEIYIRPFPDVDTGKWQVSNDGGWWPKWHPNGRELLFRGLDAITIDAENTVWTVQVETENEFQHEAPTLLFSGNYRGQENGTSFDTSADGSRLLMMRDIPEDNPTLVTEQTQLVVVDNWFEELRRLAPPDPQ